VNNGGDGAVLMMELDAESPHSEEPGAAAGSSQLLPSAIDALPVAPLARVLGNQPPRSFAPRSSLQSCDVLQCRLSRPPLPSRSCARTLLVPFMPR